MLAKEQTLIPFNSSYKTGQEVQFISKLIKQGNLSGNHQYTKLCHGFFESKFGFGTSFLTGSCSKALELAAQLCELSFEDEVIVPSFSYVTDASSFVKTGAKVIFADSSEKSPHISVDSIAKLITEKTKVLLIVHYAGISCDMDSIMQLVKEHELLLIEDCAQAINVKQSDRFLGSYGDFSTFSFHETKNIHCGEGGLLVVNNPKYRDRARQIWQEGTDKYQYEKGEKTSYEWVDLGSSYQPSEITAAFLYAQLLECDSITEKRKTLWLHYYHHFLELQKSHDVILPNVERNDFNGHIFYLGLSSKKQRDALIVFLRKNGIESSFHYLPLHRSPYWLKNNEETSLEAAEFWGDCIVRLPVYPALSCTDQKLIIDWVFRFFQE